MNLSKEQLKQVIILLLGALLVVLNQTMISPALPVIMKDLQIGATTVQWLQSGFSLVNAVVIPLSAFLLGKFSIRKLYLGSLTFFIVGALLAVWSPNFYVLLLGRLLQGVCMGIMMPMVMSLLMLIFPRESRGFAMGLVGLVIGFAPAAGPTVAGVFIDSIGWQGFFLMIAILTIILASAAFFTLDNFKSFDKADFDILSVILSTIGLLLLLGGISSFTTAENLHIPIILALAGIAVLAVFVKRQTTLDSPILRVGVLKEPRFRTAAILQAVFMTGIVGAVVILPLYIQGTLGHNATTSGLTLLPAALAAAVAGLVSGKAFDRFGVRPVALTGCVLIIIGVINFYLLGSDTPTWRITLAHAFFIVGIQTTQAATNTWGINSLDNSVIQHGNAVSSTLGQVGAGLGTALIISMTALAPQVYPGAPQELMSYLGDHLGFITIAVIMIAAIVFIFFAVNDKKSQSKNKHARGSLQPVESNLSVIDFMNKKPSFVHEDTDMREVLKIFKETETSGLPIVNDADKVSGFISDGDIMKYLGNLDASAAHASFDLYYLIDNEDTQQRLENLLKLKAKDIATKNAIVIGVNTPIEEATQILAEKKIKKLPVVDDEDTLVGTLSRRNVINRIMSEIEGL